MSTNAYVYIGLSCVSYYAGEPDEMKWAPNKHLSPARLTYIYRGVKTLPHRILTSVDRGEQHGLYASALPLE